MMHSAGHIALERNMDFQKWITVVSAFWVIYYHEPYPSRQIDYRRACEHLGDYDGIVFW